MSFIEHFLPVAAPVFNMTTLVGYTVFAAVTVQICIRILHMFMTSRKEKMALRAITGPHPHWFLGNLHEIADGKALQRTKEWTKMCGPVYKVHIGPFITEVVLTSPENIQAVTNSNDYKDSFYVTLLTPFMGDGLLVSSGKKWARNRRLLTPAFHFNILKPYQKIFSESAMTLVDRWQSILSEKPNESIEMFQHTSTYTLDSLLQCIFGSENPLVETAKRDAYIKAVGEISDVLVARVFFAPYLYDWIFNLSPSAYRLRRAANVTHNFSRDVIQGKRKDNIATGVNKKYLDFLDILLSCRDEEGEGLTDKEIQDEVDTFIFAGHHTTASALSWCIYNLACHEDIQEKCRLEVNNILGENTQMTLENLSELQYLTMSIKESLRIHPPVTRIGRQLTKPVTLPGGQTLPSDINVAIHVYGCHHNPDVWPDPERYDPERFNPDSSSRRHSHAFIPFSAGSRNCIGQHFAMNEIKTVMALLLKHFSFEVDSERIPVEYPEIVLRSKNGIWLKVKPL